MEFRARHILVEQEYEAQDVIKKIKEGEDFAVVASGFSKCPSGKQTGGDLGNFRSGQMVPSFEEAVKNLEVGQISEPVSTQFGYHIIERLELQ